VDLPVKTLLLLRHAKSSWDQPGLRDHDRPLARRGKLAAPLMGRYLVEHGLVPDRVLCSSAARTRQTWERVAACLDDQPPVEIDADLYAAGTESLLNTVQLTDDSIETLMLIGHNPGLEMLAADLAGGGDALAMGRMRLKFPTAALAELSFQSTRWQDVMPGSGQLVRFVRPKDLSPPE
jgi:phosphohistidine phosphatase